MRLSRVTIRNFRSIADLTLPLEPSCRVLVGINETGKTNILKALSLLDPASVLQQTDIREPGPGESSEAPAFVRFIFNLDNADRERVYQTLSKTVLSIDSARPLVSLKNTNLSLRQFCDTYREALYQIDLRTSARRAMVWQLPPDMKILQGWQKPSASAPPDFVLSVRKGQSVPIAQMSLVFIADFPDIPEGHTGDADLSSLSTPVADAFKSIVLNNLPGCLLWSYTEENLLPGQVPVDTFAGDPDSCLPLKHMFQLADIDDIPAAIIKARAHPNTWRNLLSRVATRSTRHFRSVWPDYKDISLYLAPNGDIIDAAIHDKHNIYDFSRRSDGFKRFITFLLIISALAKADRFYDTLLLYDEPDTSLHPSGARHLRDELIRISEDNYVVYATHSIFMIDPDQIGRHLIVRKKNEITTIEQVSESNIVDEEVIYNALGYSVFENLKPKNIVFEGWRDKHLFVVATSKWPQSHTGLAKSFANVGRCHARGSKDVHRVTSMLDLGNREYVVVSDSDRPAVEQQKAFHGDGRWIRYDELVSASPVITSEDFLAPDAFKNAILALSTQVPNLQAISPDQLIDPRGKLAALRAWLATAKLSSEQIKVALDQLKDEVFTELRPAHIEPLYYEFLASISGLL